MGRLLSSFLPALIIGTLLLSLASAAFAAGGSLPQRAASGRLQRSTLRAPSPRLCFLAENDGTERTPSLEQKRSGKRRSLFLAHLVLGHGARPRLGKTIRVSLGDERGQFFPYFSFHRKICSPSAGENPLAG